MRIFDIAKKLGMSTKELLMTTRRLGMDASYHTSALSDQEVKVIFDHFKVAKANPKGSKAEASEKAASHPVALKKAVSTPLKNSVKEGIRPVGRPKMVSAAPRKADIPVESIEKKSFVLIKKKRAPEPVITPVELAPAIPSVIAQPTEGASVIPTPDEAQPSQPLSTAVVEKEIAREASHSIPPVLPPLSIEKAASLPIPPPIPPTVPPKKVAEGTPAVSNPSLQGEQEKKRGKGDLIPELKKGLGGRFFKEKGKRDPLQGFNPGMTSTEMTSASKREWQDFRPTHKRQGPRAAQKIQPIVETTKPRRKMIRLSRGITVKEFSELVGQKVPSIISKLMAVGKMITVNQSIGEEETLFLAEEFGVKVEWVSEKTEDEMLTPLDLTGQGNAMARVLRPPVITVMGHVDHGKTSLLDAIRQTKVVEGESGGITQHIGAYTVSVHGKMATFIDTPGHEAFTAMRSRGAKVTDIVVLVVAADDGVMPQTIEAINHAKAAKVPIVVALNKVDKPEANPERVKTALMECGLVPEEWGGQTIYAEVSAKQKIGLDHFLEMILLQAEMLELKGDPAKQMKGVVIEAKLSRGRGSVATVLVQEGTLKVGDAFIAGVQFGRVRALVNDLGENVQEAPISMPVEVIGFSSVPSAGDTFIVATDERVARDIAQERMHRQRLADLAPIPRFTLGDLHKKIQEGNVEELRLVIKADAQGSTGALSEAIEKLSTASVQVRVIHKGVGGITESDALLASASQALLIGFHVRPDSSAASVVEREGVDLRLYDVIYDVIEDVKKAMEGLLEPTYKEKVVGRAEVRQVFHVQKVGTVSGCYVKNGVISRSGSRVHVLRDQVVIYDGKLGSLRRFKDDVKEVTTGFECGIGIENFHDVKVGDLLEVYVQEEVAATL